MNETAVITAIRAGHAYAFADVIDLYQAPIIRYLYRLSGSDSLARELAQDTFIRAYAEVLKDSAPAELTPLLYRLATFTASARLASTETPRWLFLKPRKKSAPAGVQNLAIAKDGLQEELLRLPFEQRACLLLHIVEGFSYYTIGRMLTLAPGTVGTHISAAKRALLQSQGKHEPACKDMVVLLSGYVDRELDVEQKSTVDRHLPNCAACRATREDYSTLREKVASLWAVPPVQDMTLAVMPKLGEVKLPVLKQQNVMHRIAIPALSAALAALAILILPFMFQSDLRSGVPAAMYRMSEAVKGITSYTVTITDDTQPPHVSYTVRMSESSLQYAGAGAYSITTNIPASGAASFTCEIIVSGNKVYATWSPNWGASQVVSPSNLDVSRALYDAQVSEMLVDVTRKQDELIAGIDCFHYRAKMDMDRFIEQQVSQMKAIYEEEDRSYDERTEQWAVAYWGNVDITVELWIGKVDYLPRQSRVTYSPRNGSLSTNTNVTTTQYSGFNQPVEIKPPVTDYGELMEGWTISTTTP